MWSAADKPTTNAGKIHGMFHYTGLQTRALKSSIIACIINDIYVTLYRIIVYLYEKYKKKYKIHHRHRSPK